MKYKVSEGPLKLREYGRNVQMMVEEAKGIEDPKKRNVLVREIIRIMATLVPQNREGDWRQKLWDQLYALADFDIDVESEYPMPDPQVVNARPKERMAYNPADSRFRQYGFNVQLMINEAAAMTDPARQKAMMSLIANIMRVQYPSQEKDYAVEASVLEHLKMLVGKKMAFNPTEIQFYKNFMLKSVPRNITTHNGFPKKKKKKKR